MIGTCDYDVDSYVTNSVVFETCFSNSTHSQIFDCGDDGETPTRNVYNNADCSGDAIETDSAEACECDDDGYCDGTVVDNVCTDIPTTTVSEDDDDDVGIQFVASKPCLMAIMGVAFAVFM